MCVRLVWFGVEGERRFRVTEGCIVRRSAHFLVGMRVLVYPARRLLLDSSLIRISGALGLQSGS